MLWMIWGIYTCCEWFEVFTHVVNDLRYLHTLCMIWGIYTRCEWFEVFAQVVNDLRYYTRCEWFEVFTHVVNDLRYLHMWMIWGIYTRCEWFEVFIHVVNDLRYLHMLWMIWEDKHKKVKQSFSSMWKLRFTAPVTIRVLKHQFIRQSLIQITLLCIQYSELNFEVHHIQNLHFKEVLKKKILLTENDFNIFTIWFYVK
jgi:hypothetical protein